MTEDKQFYFIEEETTMGWSLIDKEDVNLTKEKCIERFNYHVRTGKNPNKMRVSLWNQQVMYQRLITM